MHQPDSRVIGCPATTQRPFAATNQGVSHIQQPLQSVIRTRICPAVAHPQQPCEPCCAPPRGPRRRQKTSAPCRRSSSCATASRSGTARSIFSGWVDVPLTVKGRVEAVGAGQLLRERGFPAKRVDVAFTSNLQRAYIPASWPWRPWPAQQDTWHTDRIRRDARLNERHYGSLQGWRKATRSWYRGLGATCC